MDPSAKKLLRREARERISAMSPQERRAADAAICGHLLQMTRELGTGTVLGYLALRDEARIDGFLAAVVERGGRVLLPFSADGSLDFRPWTPSCGLQRDGEGVLAPAGGCGAVSGHDRMLVVVPGRAFDGGGGRLGRGGGYYDRLLRSPDLGGTSVVGVGYRCQVFAGVPMQAHDAGVGGVLTEEGYLPARKA